MNILIMAGGKGTRLGNPNKPLIKVCGKPMIQSVLDSVKGLGKTYIVSTESHRDIINWALSNGISYVITEGLGYSRDLLKALTITGTPALVLPSDLPFIDKDLVLRFLRITAYLRMPMVTLLNDRGSELEYTGISYVRSIEFINGDIPWVNVVIKEPIKLMNVNTHDDMGRAMTMCKEMR